MVNREMKTRFPEVVSYKKDEIVLETKNLCDEGGLVKDISLRVLKGEVVGFYGLVGSGRTELAELIFGIRRMKSGQIFIRDNKLWKMNKIYINDNVKTKINKGIFLTPEDREKNGLFHIFNLKVNISIPFIEKLTTNIGTINKSKENKLVTDVINSETMK